MLRYNFSETVSCVSLDVIYRMMTKGTIKEKTKWEDITEIDSERKSFLICYYYINSVYPFVIMRYITSNETQDTVSEKLYHIKAT
jgi:hypothetical protein